jgi:hypothetical protein
MMKLIFLSRMPECICFIIFFDSLTDKNNERVFQFCLLKNEQTVFINFCLIKGVVHAGKPFSKAHNFLFLYNNLIKISGIVDRNL